MGDKKLFESSNPDLGLGWHFQWCLTVLWMHILMIVQYEGATTNEKKLQKAITLIR